jgi:acetyl-CoA C-acetyltransferase
MANLDPRLPVIIGTGQINRRVDRGETALEPVDLIVEALRRAGTDTGTATGTSALLAEADAIRVVELLSWRYVNAAALVAGRIGADPKETAVSTTGGNSPQMLVNRTCLDIQAGRADLVLIGGAEAWRTRTAFRNNQERPPWTTQGDDVAPATTIGSETPMFSPGEIARGVVMPVQHYPMFENALRHHLGRGLDEHLVAISELWSGFSEVAATNPNAWIQRSYSPVEIRTVDPSNRMVGYPYPKLMNSNNAVEQGAALILCSVERAQALGVPSDRWVFPHAGSDAHDTPFVSNRVDLHSSPAIRVAGRSALELAGVGVDDLAHVDVYSCFPSAVQVAVAELGLSRSRQLTVTGGLSFAGGPWNNYVTHGIATMVDTLRADAGATGLCTANGGFLTKHSFGVYATEPPASGAFLHAEPQEQVDALGHRDACDEWDGPVEVESYTVMHGRDGGPENAVVAALLPDGRRTWASTADADVMTAMVSENVISRAGHVSADGTFDLRG